MSQQNLNSFLKLGYFLDYKNENISIDVSNIDNQKYQDASENELIDIGSKLWKESINSNFQSNQKHLVPISGGLDSRAILAGLLEHTEAKNIYTYTFGTPNTLDYDVGNYVAKKLGTNHTSFDLTQYIFNQNELEDISKRVDFQTILFHHAPTWEVDKKFEGCQNWCGFMGDPLAGSKLSNEPTLSLDVVKKQFIKKNSYVSSIDLTNGMNFEELIEATLIDNSLLTLDEQLDFQNRQTKYIAPHVLMQGYEYKTPFLHQPWVDFMLSVPNSFRKDQSLYKNILLHAFPKEFSYKTKTNIGLPLGVSKNAIFAKRVIDKILRITKLSSGKSINYLDFNEKIRTKKDLKDVIRTNVIDLKSRDIIDWIDIEEILNNHLANKGNYADALIVLASLEIHLKNEMKL
ncbi:MAG: asparagine synthase-related protein [Arcobacter sp.]